MGRHYHSFARTLDEYGEAAVTWNFDKRVTAAEDHWATLHAWEQTDGTHSLYCIGPQAEAVVEKINKAIYDKTPKWLKKKLAAEKKRASKSRRFRRRKAKRDTREAPVQVKKPKKGPKYVWPTAHEQLTPQFGKSRIFWDEAIDATVAIFGIRRDSMRTARQIAARRLYYVMRRNDYAFAQYKERGFTLQFTIVDGRWKGISLTAVTVSCTKDNKHPIYRRMRKWLRRTLHNLPEPEARRRREVLFDTTERMAA